MQDRLRYVLEQRGFDVRNVRAVTAKDADTLSPLEAIRKLQVLPEFTDTPDFRQLAVAFKRVRNIARLLSGEDELLLKAREGGLKSHLAEAAELALLAEIDDRERVIVEAAGTGREYRRAFSEAAKFGPAVDRFFTEVYVMVEDADLRRARLGLMKRLERLILELADISEVVPQTES
jgi:glycyl-tRNA synthetase beta chain